jgi:hypothetical protein
MQIYTCDFELDERGEMKFEIFRWMYRFASLEPNPPLYVIF